MATDVERYEIAGDLAKTATYLYGWEPAAHHKVWATALQRLFNREIPNNRLLIIAPPAHAKTNWGGVAAPTSYVGQHPNHHILYLSSAQGQALKSSVAVRDTIAVNRRWRTLYPDVVPDRTKGWAAARWFVYRPDAPGDKDPTFLAAGVGSQMVLGARADLILFDDINTQENTATAYRRDKVKAWVKQTAMSRETKDAVQLAIMTRWHTDDIAAFFENEAGYEVIVMPALGYWEGLDGDEAISMGEPLWPEEHSREFLMGKLHDMGPITFHGMYQGTPTPEGGALFKDSMWEEFYLPFVNPLAQAMLKKRNMRLRPPYQGIAKHNGDVVTLTHTVLTVDTGLKEKRASDKEGESTADYTVFALWGVGIDRQAYLLALFREQEDANKLFGHLINFYRRHKPDVVAIEDRASGTQLIQDVQEKTAIPVITMNPMVDKTERAKVQTHVIDGAFHLPDPEMFYWEDGDAVKHAYDPGDDGAWVTEFMKEHREFPSAKHDDMVDTTVYAAEYLRPFIDWFIVEEQDEPLQLPDMAAMLSQVSRYDAPVTAGGGGGPYTVQADSFIEWGVGLAGSERDGWPER